MKAKPETKRQIHVVDANAVYSVEQAREALGLRGNSLPREIRSGRLRVAKRCGRYYLLGAWILAWLEAGVVPRGKPTEDPLVNGAGGLAMEEALGKER